MDQIIETIIKEFNSGRNREDNFQALFERYHAQVYRFFRRKGLPPEDCRDLTQETFFSVYKGLKELRQESLFESWLFTVALNTFRSELELRRAKKRAVDLVPLLEEGDNQEVEAHRYAHRAVDLSANPLQEAIDKEKIEKLREALQQLPEQMRRCVQLRAGCDLSYQEIAELMGVSINTVKAHLHQAQKVLRERLSQYFGKIEV